jgi:hypothetical protein
MNSLVARSTVLLIAMYVPTVAAAQLAHHYRFNGDANDAVGGANGTLLNGATASGGRLRLDGVNDYVQFGSQLVPTTSSFSLALFASRSSTQAGFAEFYSQGASGSGVYVGLTPNAGNTRFTDLQQGVLFSPGINNLVHYGMTYDRAGGILRCYIGGVQACFVNGVANWFTSVGSNTRFGRQFDPFAEFFHGELADVRVYRSVLSASEMQELANGLTTVPEPSTWAMLATGVLGVFGVQRRRRRR